MDECPTTYRRSVDGGLHTLFVVGEIDLFERDRFCAEVTTMLAAARDGVLLDLSGVTFVDSAGIHSLLWARDQAAAGGLHLRVTMPDGAVGRVLSLTGVAPLLADNHRPPRSARDAEMDASRA